MGTGSVRILYFHQYFTTPDMSGGTRSYEVGRRLAAAGHTVDVITTWRDPSDRKTWFTSEVAGMRVHWLPVPYSNRLGYLARILAFFRFAIASGRYAKGLDGDVVFATSTPLTIALPAVYASKRKRLPMVFEVRDLWPELPIAVGALRNPIAKWLARRLERFAYRNSRHIVALSPGMASGVERTGFPRERISVVPNGSDLELFERNRDSGLAFRRRLDIADDKILVGYTGTLGRINGVGFLVETAAALLDDDRFRFIVVGDGQELQSVSDRANELGVLGRNLMILPEMKKHEIPAVLSGVDVATSLFLPIPEMENNSANKFFDALAAGCCVAINYGGWQAELLRSANTGIQISANPKEAARQLSSLADEPSRIEGIGKNARRVAEEQFSRDMLVDKIERILQQTTDGTTDISAS